MLGMEVWFPDSRFQWKACEQRQRGWSGWRRVLARYVSVLPSYLPTFRACAGGTAIGTSKRRPRQAVATGSQRVYQFRVYPI